MLDLNWAKLAQLKIVHCLYNDESVISSYDFQTLHLGRHLSDIDEEGYNCKLWKERASYALIGVADTSRYKQVQLPDEPLNDYTEKYYISRAPKDI